MYVFLTFPSYHLVTFFELCQRSISPSIKFGFSFVVARQHKARETDTKSLNQSKSSLCHFTHKCHKWQERRMRLHCRKFHCAVWQLFLCVKYIRTATNMFTMRFFLNWLFSHMRPNCPNGLTIFMRKNMFLSSTSERLICFLF